MSPALFSSLDAFAFSGSRARPHCLFKTWRGVSTGRGAGDPEILQAAQKMLAGQVRGTHVLNSPAVVKDFLRTRLGTLSHELFAIVHVDSQHRVLDYVERCCPTDSQRSLRTRRSEQGR